MRLKVYWIKLREAPAAFREWGITAADEDDALLLLNQTDLLENRIDATMIEFCREVRDVKELDQNHVVPNMGVIVQRGVWYPNFSGLS